MTKNIWAVGRNYAEHAKELGNALPQEPLFFLKSGSCIQSGPKITLIPGLGEIHHEIELALKLNSALEFSEFTLALDLTDRTAQNKAKKEGLPWTKAKSFKGACVVGDWKAFKMNEDFLSQEISLKVNSEIRQLAPLSQMIFKPEVLLKALKSTFPLEPGDIVLTGTPSGVGAIKAGDQLEAQLGIATKNSWTVITEPSQEKS